MEAWIKEAAQRRYDVLHAMEQRNNPNAGEQTSHEPLKPVVNVWGYRSPLGAQSPFTVKARIKCFAGESLDGVSLKVVDPETGKVLGQTPAATSEDTKNGIFEGEIELNAPVQTGFHKWTVIADSDGASDILAQRKFPFSVVPKSDRTVHLSFVDDKTGKGVAGATAFLYDTDLDKTSPLRFDSDKDGKVVCNIASGSRYKVEVVAEDYVTGIGEIPATKPDDNSDDSYDVKMRNKFNVKMRTAYF